MTWAVPSAWHLIVLSLAAYRVWRLVAVDTILDPVRKHVPRDKWLERWLYCPWCAGAWISAGWWLAWIGSPRWTLVIATPWAISLLVGLISRNLDP